MVINATMQVSLPVDLVTALQGKLREMIDIHAKEVASLERRARVEVVPEKIEALHEQLRRAGARMTIQHVFRALLTTGLESGLSGAELYKRMAQDEIAAGRPGAKRGSRAA